jgi:hypothetical protein
VTEQAGARPDNDAAVHELAVVLERMVITDPGFAEQFRALWPQARAELLALQAGSGGGNADAAGEFL